MRWLKTCCWQCLRTAHNHLIAMIRNRADAKAWQLAKISAAGLDDLPAYVCNRKDKAAKIMKWYEEGDGFYLPASMSPEVDLQTVARRIMLFDDETGKLCQPHETTLWHTGYSRRRSQSARFSEWALAWRCCSSPWDDRGARSDKSVP